MDLPSSFEPARRETAQTETAPAPMLISMAPISGRTRRPPRATWRSTEPCVRKIWAWGVRDLRDVVCAAGAAGLSLEDLVDMPANNCPSC